MERRTFAKGLTAALATAAGGATLGFARIQEDELAYAYPDVALAGRSVLDVLKASREPLQEAHNIGDAIARSAYAVLSFDFDGATGQLDRAASLADELGPRLGGLAEELGVTEYEPLLQAVLSSLRESVAMVRETRQLVVLRVPRRSTLCVLDCVRGQLECLSQLRSPALACGLAALPGLKFGPKGYAAVFFGCLAGKVPDVLSEIIWECMPPLVRCVGECELDLGRA